MSDWYADLVVLAGKTPRTGDLRQDIGQTLANLNTMFLNTPTVVLDAYRRLEESAIAFAAETIVDRLIEGELSFSLAPASDPVRIALDLGAQLRALDQAHLLLAASLGPPADPMVEWRSRDGTHFIIPRPFGRGGRRPPAKGDPYPKRGLLKHMVVPREVSGLAVEVVHIDGLLPAEADRTHLRFGAALIPGLEMAVEALPGPAFRVSSVDFPSDTILLEKQVEQGFLDACHVLVWPELSVGDEHQHVIGRALAEKFLSGGAPLQLVIAGSRHVAMPEGVVNRALILTGNGQPPCDPYDKVIPYFDAKFGEEAILTGKKLVLLATEIGIFSIGICKDFCDLGVRNLFESVPVDFILVPSFGNAETMRGHQDVAKHVSVANGTRTFVVQQDIPQSLVPHDVPADMLGYVLPPSANPREAELSALVCTAIFSLHETVTSH